MVHCIAFGCKNKNEAFGRGVSFFRLPKDKTRRARWIKMLRLRDPPNTDNVRLCNEHFAPDSFEPDMQADMGFKKRKTKRLKPDANPDPTRLGFAKTATPREASVRRVQKAEKHEVRIHDVSSFLVLSLTCLHSEVYIPILPFQFS